MDQTHNTSSSSDPKDTEVNEYLLLREIKMKRNQERLKELGLIVVTPKTPPSCSLVSSSSSSSFVSSSPNSSLTRTACPDPAIKTTLLPTAATTVTTTAATTTATRRSKRLNKASSSSYQNKNINNNINNTTNTDTDASQEVLVTTQSNHKKQKKTIPSSSSSSTISKPPIIKPGTSRSITLDVQKVLCGPYCHYPVFVGRTLSCTGKAAVLAHAHDMSCIGDGNHQRLDAISFNKYSGVCEFQNDVIFLWVNMPSPDSNVKNEFVIINRKEEEEEEEEVQMTWFGGSKMRIDSPTIQRLLDIGKRASAGDLSDSCGIVLWYRLYNVSKKVFQPYSCLGRLGYHCHDDDGGGGGASESSHPVKIIFNLLDYKYLKVAKGPHGSLSLWDEILQMQKASSLS